MTAESGEKVMEKTRLCNRRGFIRNMSLAGLASVVGEGNAAPAVTAAGTVRFCAFADIHYSQDGFWPHGDRAWLDRILDRAVASKSDFVVSLGDMSFNPVRDRAYEEYYRDFKPVKTYQVLGNHEFEGGTYEEIAPVMGLSNGYYSWDCNGFRFIALDPHYHWKDGKLVHFEKRCSYPEEKTGFFFLPPDQMEWLRETILASPYPCVILSHESLERHAGIHGRQAVLDLFAEANRACPGKVRLCINGHEHKDSFRFIDGIAYLDLNSASYDISSDHAAYPEEVRKRCGSLRCCLTWNDPLSAVITLGTDGTLRIEGARSTFYLGVTPEMAKWRPDGYGRIASPVVQSVDLKVSYA